MSDDRLEVLQAELATVGARLEAGDPEAEARLDAIRAELAAMAIAEGKPNPFGPGLLDTLEAEWKARRRRRVMVGLGIFAVFFLLGMYII